MANQSIADAFARNKVHTFAAIEEAKKASNEYTTTSISTLETSKVNNSIKDLSFEEGNIIFTKQDGTSSQVPVPDSDTKVTQTPQITNGSFPLLLRGTSAGTTTTTTTTSFAAGITANPSTGKITATGFVGDLTGNANTATKATQDSEGNVINTTYETKGKVTEQINATKEYAAGLVNGLSAKVDQNIEKLNTLGSAAYQASEYFTNDAQTKATSAETAAKAYAKEYADGIKDSLLNGAGDAYDTLQELGALIDENTDAIDALEQIATNKADKVHEHQISDVIELQTILDTKSNTDHTHPIANSSQDGFITATDYQQFSQIANEGIVLESLPYSLPEGSQWKTIIFGNNKYIGIDEYCERYISSVNGFDWEAPIALPQDYWGYNILNGVYHNGKFILLVRQTEQYGDNTALNPEQGLVPEIGQVTLQSIDGINWTKIIIPKLPLWESFNYHGWSKIFILDEYFVLASYVLGGESIIDGQGAIPYAYSVDGINWTYANPFSFTELDFFVPESNMGIILDPTYDKRHLLLINDTIIDPLCPTSQFFNVEVNEEQQEVSLSFIWLFSSLTNKINWEQKKVTFTIPLSMISGDPTSYGYYFYYKNNKIYFLAGQNTSGGALIFSSSNGIDWTLINNTNNFNYTGLDFNIFSLTPYKETLFALSHYGNTIFSTVDGENWEEITSLAEGHYHDSFRNLYNYCQDATLFVYATDNTYIYSQDGQTWHLSQMRLTNQSGDVTSQVKTALNLSNQDNIDNSAVLVSIPTTGWSYTSPYTMDIPVEGVYANQVPIFSLVAAGDEATEAEMDAVNLITDITTGDGFITVEVSDIPMIGFSIALYGLSNNIEYSPADYSALSGRVSALENQISTAPVITNVRTYELLWSNPNMATAFATQTLSLNLSAYEAVMINFSHFADESSHEVTCLVGKKGFSYIIEPSGYFSAREFTVNSTGIVFGGGKQASQSWSTSDNNQRCIPRYIYGIKTQ